MWLFPESPGICLHLEIVSKVNTYTFDIFSYKQQRSDPALYPTHFVYGQMQMTAHRSTLTETSWCPQESIFSFVYTVIILYFHGVEGNSTVASFNQPHSQAHSKNLRTGPAIRCSLYT